jgi:nitrite reductase (NADH) small subunit
VVLTKPPTFCERNPTSPSRRLRGILISGTICLPLFKVAQLSQLPAGSVTEVTVGDTPYAICNVAGRVTALAGTCPHRGGPLGQGAIHGNYVVCPWHAWQWDCATGANDFDATRLVPTFKVEVAGDDILIEIP